MTSHRAPWQPPTAYTPRHAGGLNPQDRRLLRAQEGLNAYQPRRAGGVR